MPLGRGGATQFGPIGGEGSHKRDAIATGFVSGNRAFGGLIKECFTFETDSARQNSTIDLRQSYIHRDIACGQAVETVLPILFGAGGEHYLKDRGFAGGGQGERIVGAAVPMGIAHSERGAVENHIWWRGLK